MAITTKTIITVTTDNNPAAIIEALQGVPAEALLVRTNDPSGEFIITGGFTPSGTIELTFEVATEDRLRRDLRLSEIAP